MPDSVETTGPHDVGCECHVCLAVSAHEHMAHRMHVRLVRGELARDPGAGVLVMGERNRWARALREEHNLQEAS